MDTTLHTPKELVTCTLSDWTDDPVAVEGEITRRVSQLCYRMRGYRRKAVKFAGYIRFRMWTEGDILRVQHPGLYQPG